LCLSFFSRCLVAWLSACFVLWALPSASGPPALTRCISLRRCKAMNTEKGVVNVPVSDVTPSQRPAVQHPKIFPDAFELQVLHFCCYLLFVGSVSRDNCARYVCLVTKAPSADRPSSHPRIPIESPHVRISPNSKATRRRCSPTMLAQWRAWRDVRRKVSSSHWPSSAYKQSVDWLFRTVGLSAHGEISCADMPWVDSRTVTHKSHHKTMSMCVVFGVLRNPHTSLWPFHMAKSRLCPTPG